MDDGGGHLGLGQEAMGGDIEQNLRLGVVIAKNGEGGVIGGAGSGGNALGHLFLHHDGDGVEALALQQGRENGRRNIIRKIGTGHGPQALEFLGHQGLHIGLQHVLPDNFQIVKFAHGQLQDGLQALVQLAGHDLPCPQAQLLGQRADAGADLQHAGGAVHARILGDLLGDPGGDQKILALGLGKMEAMGGQKGLHDLDVGYVNHSVHLIDDSAEC